MPRPRLKAPTQGVSRGPSFVAYYRVSTDQQGRSGLGLEAQKAAVAAYLASPTAEGGRLVAEFEEVESGRKNDRPKLAAALAMCRARRATLVIAKLDRLARNTHFLLSVVNGAGAGGVTFCDLPKVDGPAGKFLLTQMAAVAELEAGLISQRTKAALAAAKARGVKLGGPHNVKGFDTAATRRARAARTDQAQAHLEDVWPFIQAARKAGATSLREIAAALTARGVRPPSVGGEVWHASQVHRLLKKRAASAEPGEARQGGPAPQ